MSCDDEGEGHDDAGADAALDQLGDVGADSQQSDTVAGDATPDSAPDDVGADQQGDAAVGPTTSSVFGLGGTSPDRGYSVAVDSSGNVTVAGNFQGTVDFGTGPKTAAGLTDVFVASYDSSGNARWVHCFGASSIDGAYGVAVDSSGNVAVTGQFQGTVDLGGGPQTSAGLTDVFLVSYDSSGTVRWAQRFGAVDGDSGSAVATDSAGNVTVTGAFRETVDFGTGALTSAGDRDVFVARYDSSGAPLWAERFGSTDHDSGHGVAVDGSGNVAVVGSFENAVDFGTGALTSAGEYDVFVASYDSSGAPLWAKRFGSTGFDNGHAVAKDSAGNVTIAGSFAKTVDFGTGPLSSAGDRDGFVASYDSSGTPLWARRFGGASMDSASGVATDSAGNVTVAGYFQGTADFGTGPLSSAGDWDGFVAGYDSAGTPLWAKRFGSAGSDQGSGVTADSSGQVTVTGHFEDTVDFGSGPLSSAGDWDAFVLRLTPP